MQSITHAMLMLGKTICFFFFLSSRRALCRYTVMSGTPEKILEHLLETIKLDSNGNDAIGGRACRLLLPFPCFIELLKMIRHS